MVPLTIKYSFLLDLEEVNYVKGLWKLTFSSAKKMQDHKEKYLKGEHIIIPCKKWVKTIIIVLNSKSKREIQNQSVEEESVLSKWARCLPKSPALVVRLEPWTTAGHKTMSGRADALYSAWSRVLRKRDDLTLSSCSSDPRNHRDGNHQSVEMCPSTWDARLSMRGKPHRFQFCLIP